MDAPTATPVVADNKRLEEALRESEEGIRALLNATADAALLTDTAGVVLALNETLARRLNADMEQLLGACIYDFLPPDVAQKRKAHIDQVACSGQPLRFEEERQGMVLENTIYPIPDATGKVCRLVIYGRDITDYRHMEEALSHRLRQLDAVRHIGLELAAQMDLDTLLRSVVSRAVDLLEGAAGAIYLCRPEQARLELRVWVGSNVAPVGSTLRPGEGLSGKVWETGTALAVEDYQHWAGRAAIYDGYPWTAVAGAPVRWGGELIGVLNVLADAPRVFSAADTETLELFATQAAVALKNAQLYANLQRQIRRLQETQEQLVHSVKMASLGILAGGIAHQVRNPLGIISASVQLLLEHPEDACLRQQCAEKISAAMERASQTVENLLRFAHPQGDPMRAVDLEAVLEETLALLDHQLTGQRIAVAREFQRDLPRVWGNPGLLQHIFMHLILNTSNAMPQGGLLTVATRVGENGQVEVQVRDTGCGIPPENLRRIFEPFFTTMPVGKGAGLGLSLSYSIIQQHQGTIEVESQVGQGSTFTVRLPCLAGSA
jgi:PAS domain S-box-containing protein